MTSLKAISSLKAIFSLRINAKYVNCCRRADFRLFYAIYAGPKDRPPTVFNRTQAVADIHFYMPFCTNSIGAAPARLVYNLAYSRILFYLTSFLFPLLGKVYVQTALNMVELNNLQGLLQALPKIAGQYKGFWRQTRVCKKDVPLF
ncbi:MAG: hypothetical protein ACK5L3_02495 [Oscillospiraceae bacterium]